MQNIGDKIKNRRLSLELSLQQVADYVGVTRTTVMRWEKGIIENMKRDKIQKLSEILLVTPPYILGLTENIEDVIIARLKKNAYSKIEKMNKEQLDKLISLIDLMF